jgi:hypothetical protein
MRDVVNLLHVLGFSSREDGGADDNDDDRRRIATRSREVRMMTSFTADHWRPSSNRGTPPLPQRGVLEGKGGAGVDEAPCAPHDTVRRDGLPSPPVRAGDNGNSWIRSGEGVRDDGGRTGAALIHLVVALYCAAISLAAPTANEGGAGHCRGLAHDDNHGDACGKYECDDDGNAAAAAATLPHFWWRALDVSMEDIANAMDTLRGECTWKGR